MEYVAIENYYCYAYLIIGTDRDVKKLMGDQELNQMDSETIIE